MPAVTIALTNAKGGVAKTTSAISLACALARQGYKTLLVDTDSQASASLSLGINKEDLRPSLADIVYEEKTSVECIRSTYINNLDLITSSFDLVGFDITYAQQELLAESATVLTRLLSPAKARYEVIILDTSPSYGLLPINVLCFSDYFIVPVQPSYLASEGLVNLLQAVNKTRQGYGQAARLMGILFTMVQRTKDCSRFAELIRSRLEKETCFQAEIPRSAKVPEATAKGVDVWSHSPRCAAARAYEAFAAEVVSRVPELKVG